VSVTTPSFVPPDIEPCLSSHYYSPTDPPFGESSDTPPHSPSFDDDDAIQRYNDLISGTGK
jgi:hypothetical protein